MFHFLILITVPAALIVSYYTLLEYLGTSQVSCDFGNKFRSDIIAIIPGSKYLISVSIFFGVTQNIYSKNRQKSSTSILLMVNWTSEGLTDLPQDAQETMAESGTSILCSSYDFCLTNLWNLVGSDPQQQLGEPS